MLKYRSHFQVTIASGGILTLLKLISFLHSYLIMIIPARFKKESPNFYKKAKPRRILAAVVKEGGQGTGWSQPPASRTLMSLCLPTPAL